MSFDLIQQLALGNANAAITLEAQLLDDDFAPVGSPITAGFTHLGNGNWVFEATFDDEVAGWLKFYRASDDYVFGSARIEAPDEALLEAVAALPDAEEIRAEMDESSTKLAAIAAKVQYLGTNPSGTVRAPSSAFSDRRGDSWQKLLPVSADLESSVLVVTLHYKGIAADNKAVLQVRSDTGVVYANGASYATPGHSSITTDETTGKPLWLVDEVLTALLPRMELDFDVRQELNGDVETLLRGTFKIT